MTFRALARGAAAASLLIAMPAPAAPTTQPLAPLPMLPSIARVRVELGPGQVLVTEDVSLPRGDWRGEPLDFYVAFGAPGVPRAIDAHLLTLRDGELEAEDDTPSEAVTVERAPRRPKSAYPLLGRESMAGVVVHLRKESLSRALGPGNMAQIRIRTAIDLPPGEPADARGLVVRLGSSRGTPLTLGRIQVLARKGAPAIARAEARLCGPEADPHPLAISGAPRDRADRVAPVLAVRHASDDLCLRVETR